MNRIRKAGEQERFESKGFHRFLVSRLPDFLLIFSCVPAFLINSSSAADVVIRFQKIHGILCARRNRETHPDRCGNSSGTPPGNGRDNYSVGGAAGRTDRRLSGIYGNNRDGDFKERFHPSRWIKFGIRSKKLVWA
jgi:hypothetical protein